MSRGSSCSAVTTRYVYARYVISVVVSTRVLGTISYPRISNYWLDVPMSFMSQSSGINTSSRIGTRRAVSHKSIADGSSCLRRVHRPKSLLQSNQRSFTLCRQRTSTRGGFQGRILPISQVLRTLTTRAREYFHRDRSRRHSWSKSTVW